MIRRFGQDKEKAAFVFALAAFFEVGFIFYL